MAVTRGQTRYAAFYYGWFTSGIGGDGHPTSADAYPPVLAPPPGGPYDSSAAAVMSQHAAWALQGHIDTLMCSDWGKGHAYFTYENTTALLRFLDGPSNPHPWLKAAAYYELEQGAANNPSVASIVAHFEDLRADMFPSPSYRRIGGNPVVFVYDPAFSGSGYNRWTSARAVYETNHPGESVYLGLPIWNNGAGDVWTTAAALAAPNLTWHKYAVTDQPTTDQYAHTEAAGAGYSFTVSPGFHNPPAAVVLTRSVAGFAAGIASGIARHDLLGPTQGLDWVLITSFNELGEGSNVEPSTGFGPSTAEQSTYLDIMANAFPFPSTGTYPALQLSTVSTTNVYHDISDYVRAIDGVQIMGQTEQTTPFGVGWKLEQGIGVRSMQPITLEGFYNDDGTALSRLHEPRRMGTTIYLRTVFAERDAIESRVVVKSAQKTAQVRQLTGFEAVLALTGQPSTGIA